MRHKFSSRRRQAWLLTVCAVLLVCLSQAALAQSGRRQKPGVASTPPPEVKDEETQKPEAKPQADKRAPTASIIVGGDRLSMSATLGPNYVDEAAESCVQELNKTGGLEARGGGAMTRKEAVDRAKKETGAYVLWLEVRIDGTRGEDVSLNYTLFAPQTAKVTAFGNIYASLRGVGRGPVGVGIPSAGRRMPLQYQMREAGRDVAGRVADKLRTVTRD